MNSLAAELEAVRQETKFATVANLPPDEPAGEKRNFCGFESDPQGGSKLSKIDNSPNATQTTPGEGLTNAELSERLNVPKSTIEKWKAKIQRGESLARVKNPAIREWRLGEDAHWYPL